MKDKLNFMECMGVASHVLSILKENKQIFQLTKINLHIEEEELYSYIDQTLEKLEKLSDLLE
jgi:hypothetical protein